MKIHKDKNGYIPDIELVPNINPDFSHCNYVPLAACSFHFTINQIYGEVRNGKVIYARTRFSDYGKKEGQRIVDIWLNENDFMLAYQSACDEAIVNINDEIEELKKTQQQLLEYKKCL